MAAPIILTRYCYSGEATRGRLFIDGQELHTLERPWLPGAPGGLPFLSCIPDGRYSLLPHVRPDGDQVLALRNPELGVWYSKQNVPDAGGRYLVLLHAANYVEEVQGCIAVGLVSLTQSNRPMVGSSRDAMRRLMAYYRTHNPTELVIECTKGAVA